MDMDLGSHTMVLVLPIATVVSKASHTILARERLKLRLPLKPMLLLMPRLMLMLTMVSTDMVSVLPTILTVSPTVMLAQLFMDILHTGMGFTDTLLDISARGPRSHTVLFLYIQLELLDILDMLPAMLGPPPLVILVSITARGLLSLRLMPMLTMVFMDMEDMDMDSQVATHMWLAWPTIVLILMALVPTGAKL